MLILARPQVQSGPGSATGKSWLDVHAYAWYVNDVAKITGIVDGKLILQNYATSTQNTQSATWKPLYQHDDGRYRRGGHASKHWHAVVDEVVMDDEKEFP